MTSWADMPQDIGYLILDKLPEALEHVRFGAVSKFWYAISKEYQRLHKHSRRALPMLLVPSPDAPAKPEPPRLYALSSLGKHYQNLRHALPFSRFRFCCSTNGWLATQNEDFTISLLYPFGSELATIHLPRLRADCGLKHDFHIHKLIVSPESTWDDYKIVAIFGDFHQVATIKSGEQSWIVFGLRNVCFYDIIFFKNRLFAVSSYFVIAMINIEARPMRYKIIHLKDGTLRYLKTYLVESSSSELFVLGRVQYIATNEEGGDEVHNEVSGQVQVAEREDEDTSEEDEEEEEEDEYDDEGEEESSDDDVEYWNPYIEGTYNTVSRLTEKFNVYKVKLDERNINVLEMKESKHLDGNTFFVGDNESMSFPARSFPGSKFDSIYFTDDHICHYDTNGPEDVGCYNVKSGSIHRFYTMKPHHKKNVPHPVWVVPKVSMLSNFDSK